MLDIKILCKKIDKTFLAVLDENPMAAAFMLANLYRSMDHVSEDKLVLAKTTLTDTKKSLRPKHIQTLWETITSIPSKRLNLMDNSHKRGIRRLKHEMIRDFAFFKHIDADDLVAQGQKSEFYREVLVALIRKHLHENKLKDPFEKGSFSYKLLNEGGSEQNSRYLTRYIKDCESFPINNIVLLGGKNHEIAEFILIDLKSSNIRFEIGSHFVHKHPSLRKDVAKDWQDFFDTLPLNSREAKFIKEELPKLKQRFDEFKGIETDRRARRDNQIAPKVDNWAAFRTIFTKSFGLGFIVALPAKPITMPIFLGYGAYNLYCILSHKPNQTQRPTADLQQTKRLGN
ncbi:hypothetical protein [Candidatus Berkiella aquae]|uniref:Uncharacterized protein n=1 Tax=Candidatus Berkiella aquae TaxID=295108 RepID=A0A0Q9YF65_9GAMM|nr:hypothetical protein [Candidatus Berkiella aquae]MCS5712880.1 hypothetical protein [Candidatus Berkiella aquae]